jgi:hypothetical protein
MPLLQNPNLPGVGQLLSNTTAALKNLSIFGRVNESAARKATSGLNAQGRTAVPSVNTGGDADRDWRVRISLGKTSTIFYNNTAGAGILAPLSQTRGVVFPYTPSVTISYVNTYTPATPTHSINSTQSYQSSDVSIISITGVFTAQTQAEADYVLAAIHFFRSASKMFFGSSDTGNQGNPPPLLFLHGYGPSYFNNVPTIITSFTHTMADDVDFVTSSNGTRIGASSSVTINLVPQYSRLKISKFNLDQFASGKLLEGFI